MQVTTAVQRLKDHLTAHGVICEAGASKEQIADFQRRHGAGMPVDFMNYLMTMNGSSGDYGFGMIRFWGLNEIRSIADEIPGSTPPTAAVVQAAYHEPIAGTQDYFVFADFLYDAQLYAIHLPPSGDGQNRVILLDGAAPIQVADSFSHFIKLYIDSPQSLRLIVD